MVEAELDFSDEGDVAESEESEESEAKNGIAALAAALGLVLECPSGERLRDGVRLAITGPPNAGKSSLITVLTLRDVAIVPPVPGTTRDRPKANLTLSAIHFDAIDTAGLTEHH